jgi:hypothetical protein
MTYGTASEKLQAFGLSSRGACPTIEGNRADHRPERRSW